MEESRILLGYLQVAPDFGAKDSTSKASFPIHQEIGVVFQSCRQRSTSVHLLSSAAPD